MGERKTVIVLQKDGAPVGVYGSVADLCAKTEGFSYSYLKSKSRFPYNYKGHTIYKISFR